MNNYIKKKTLISSTYCILTILMEFFMFIWFGWGVFPSYFILDIAFIIFISILLFMCKHIKMQVSIASVLFVLEILIIYINICIMKTLNDVFSINMLYLVGETATVLTLDMLPIIPFFILFIVFLGLFITSLIIINKKVKYDSKEVELQFKLQIRNVILYTLTICMLLTGVSRLFFIQSKENFLRDDNYLFKTFYSNRVSLQKFGIFTFYSQQVARKIFNPYQITDMNLNDVKKYLETKEYENTDSSLYDVCAGQNVIVIMAESFEWYAINKELTPTIYALASGYDFSHGLDFYDISYDAENNATLTFDKNKYDVLLEGKYGLTLTNFYSKAKTDYSEASVILGSYPYNKSYNTGGDLFGGYSATGLYENLDYNFTLPSVLKDAGKIDVAQYFHNYKKDFYGRNTLIKQFGFDNTKFIEDLTNVATDPNLALSRCVQDSEVVGKYKEEMFPVDKKFLSFLTTVTTHGEYNTKNPLLTKQYKYIDDNVNYLWKTENPDVNSNSGIIRKYLASCLDTEWVITLMLDYLLKNNLYNKTTIVFYADHNAFYNDLDKTYKPIIYSKDGYTLPGEVGVTYNKWAMLNNSSLEYDYKNLDVATRYNVPCFIYSTAINNETINSRTQYINKFANSFDLTTTIFTLMGVDYNENYYMGYPIMCEAENKIGSLVYVSRTGGMFNEDIYTDDSLHLISVSKNVTIEDVNKFSQISQQIILKNIYITLLYEYNLFEKVNS